MAIFYHVTAHETWLKFIRKQGLTPRAEKRGRFADGQEPRIYLFEDEATAEDGLMNWLLDECPGVRWFALLRVEVPDDEVREDPELAGAYYVTRPIPADRIQLLRKIDGGEED